MRWLSKSHLPNSGCLSQLLWTVINRMVVRNPMLSSDSCNCLLKSMCCFEFALAAALFHTWHRSTEFYGHISILYKINLNMKWLTGVAGILLIPLGSNCPEPTSKYGEQGVREVTGEGRVSVSNRREPYKREMDKGGGKGLGTWT